MTDDDRHYYGSRIEKGDLLPAPGARLAETTFQQWLALQSFTASH